MGLLDDAIREHLELKRRRGADPGEIAIQERAALEPVYRSEDAATEAPDPDAEPRDLDLPPAAPLYDALSSQDLPEEIELREDAAGEAPPPAEHASPPTAAVDPASPQGDPLAGSHGEVAAQETAEIDMQAVLAADDAHGGPAGDPLGAEAIPSEGVGTDWDFPGAQQDDPPPEPIPGQERMPFE